MRSLYRLAWVFYLALAVGAAIWIGLRQGRIGSDIFFDRALWWQHAVAGLGAAGLLLGLWWVAARKIALAAELEREIGLILSPITRSELLALAVLSGFSEELFFRGAMQPSWGWIPATVLFAALHSGPGPSFRLWTLFAGVAGLVLAALMAWSGNLLAPAVAHMTVNAVNLSRISKLYSGLPTTPDPGPA